MTTGDSHWVSWSTKKTQCQTPTTRVSVIPNRSRTGEDMADVLSRVLQRQLDFDTLPPMVPARREQTAPTRGKNRELSQAIRPAHGSSKADCRRVEC